MDIMAKLVRHNLKTSYKDLPAEAVEAAKKAILDTLGVIIAGSSDKAVPLLLDQIKAWGGPEEALVSVFGVKAPAHLAAFINGTMARALEIADVYDGFPLHPSSSTVPVALAAAERQGGVSGQELITVTALAHDLIVRFALATKIGPIQSGRYNLFKIFPPTGAAGRLLGLDEPQLMNAMGIAFTQMVGDAQSAYDGAMTHYLQQGVVAQSAIECAQLAQRGITGSHNILEGPNGLFNAFEPDPDLAALTADLGQSFKGEDLSIKLYSSCRATHEAVDLALELAKEENLDPEMIEKIEVRVDEPVFNLTCLNRKTHPQTEVDAQFSLPYCVAAALVRGDMFVTECREEVFNDSRITGLAGKIHPVIDRDLKTELIIGTTIMSIQLKDGRQFTRRTSYPQGNPANPAEWGQCVDKFNKCLKYSARPFSKGRAAQIIDQVSRLEEMADVAALAGLLAADN